MNKLLLSALVLSFSVKAQNIIETKTFTAEIVHAQKINAVVVETQEACVLTYDPQYADDEDTLDYRVLHKSYESKKALQKLVKDGYSFKGYQDNEKCSIIDSTFPQVLTTSGSRYFTQYTRLTTLLKAANDQKAWKTVRRVYIKGFKELQSSLEEKRTQAQDEILDRIL